MTPFKLQVFRALRALPTDTETQEHAHLLLAGYRFAALNIARAYSAEQAEAHLEATRAILFRSLEALAAGNVAKGGVA